MRKVLTILILLFSFTAFCKDKHKPLKMPVSRWKEIKRMKPDSAIVPFTDTLYISFKRKDSFSYHNLNGFIYNGGYTINDEDSLLDFGTSRYKIAMKRPTTLVLKNDEGIFVLAPDLSDTAKIIVIDSTAEKLIPVTSIDQMIGHWTVYKRTAKDQGSLDVATTIEAAYITGPSTDGKQGYIYSGADAKNNPSWYIKSLGADQVLDCDGKNPRILKVIKCQKGEMILEENDIKYYFKQFK